MGRKSKQPGGHKPLTHHERTKKFASSEYGTVSRRLAGHSQYQLGDCALSVTSLLDGGTTSSDTTTPTATIATALCSPSGYLYQEAAIVEYLLIRTQDLNRQRSEWQAQQLHQQEQAAAQTLQDHKRKISDFEATQQTIAVTHKKAKTSTAFDKQANEDLKRVSYWLAGSQPAAADSSNGDDALATTSEPPPDRPGSPMTGQALRRKDLWPVRLRTLDGKLVCAVSQKSLSSAPCVAYWTSNSSTSGGEIVHQSVYRDLQLKQSKKCPLTDAKIRHTRQLQQGGSSFAASKQAVEVTKYRPTIT